MNQNVQEIDSTNGQLSQRMKEEVDHNKEDLQTLTQQVYEHIPAVLERLEALEENQPDQDTVPVNQSHHDCNVWCQQLESQLEVDQGDIVWLRHQLLRLQQELQELAQRPQPQVTVEQVVHLQNLVSEVAQTQQNLLEQHHSLTARLHQVENWVTSHGDHL